MVFQISLTYFIEFEQFLIVFDVKRRQEEDRYRVRNCSSSRTQGLSEAAVKRIAISLRCGYFPINFSHIGGVYGLSIWMLLKLNSLLNWPELIGWHKVYLSV